MTTTPTHAAKSLVKAANLLLASGGTHVPVKDLPPVLRKALAEVGYNKPSIELIPKTTFSLQYGGGGDGRREFIVVVDLKNETYKVGYGSWGGANINSPNNLIDNDSTDRPLPEAMAVIHGSEGGTYPTQAHITVNPTTLAPMLPTTKKELTPQEQKALNFINGLTSSGRIDAFDRSNDPGSYFGDKPVIKLGKYGPNNPIIQSLITKGLLKMTKSGAISLSLEGKNAVTREYM